MSFLVSQYTTTGGLFTSADEIMINQLVLIENRFRLKKWILELDAETLKHNLISQMQHVLSIEVLCLVTT